MINENNAQAVVIQSWWRGYLSRKQTIKLAKTMTKRRYIVRQLLDTQQNYIRDLSRIISDFKVPLFKKKILTQQEISIIFSNIESIKLLNQQFFGRIFPQLQTYWHYKVIFKSIQKQIPFFKVYFQYFKNYPSSNALLDRLLQTNKQLAEHIQSNRLNPKFKQLSIKDFLIKPVQRLPKYVLIMKQIKRSTPSWHPDYPNISKVLQMFQQVNNSNNQKLNQLLNQFKLSQIQRSLLHPHPIAEPGVEFVLQQPVSILAMDGQVIQCTMYLLSTQLLTVKRGHNRDRLIASVPFKHGGQIMQNDEHYYYKNSFTVQNGEGDSCTFVFHSCQEKDLLLKKIYNQIIKSQQKNLERLALLCNNKSATHVQYLQRMNRLDLLPEVQVLGTEERIDSMLKYTVYIIEIKIKNIKQKLFLRFSELLSLQSFVQENNISIKNVLLKSTWVLNHKPRKIQERKMNIQRFLKQLLSKREIMQEGKEILQKLGLSQDFYDLPNKFKQTQQIMKKSSISQRSTNSQEQVIYSKNQNKQIRISICNTKRASIFHCIAELKEDAPIRKNSSSLSKRLSIQDILKANQLNLGHYTRLTQPRCSQNLNFNELEFNVLIPWIQKEKGFVKQKIRIGKNHRIHALIQKISNQIGLKYFLDFRLYLQRQYVSRLIDEDQHLPKILDQIKNGKYTLIFKKLIYLTPQMEERQIRTDRVRLHIVASQVIYDCKKDKYPLTYSSILRLSVYVGMTQLYKSQQNNILPQKIDFNLIRSKKLAIKSQEMVANRFTTFYDSSKTWEKDYQKVFQQLYNKLRLIGCYNSQVFRDSKIEDQQKLYNTTQLGQLAAFSIINEIKKNDFYGSISFIVQISHWFQKILNSINNDDVVQNRNCWLIISYSKVSLYSISLTQCIFTLSYDDIMKMTSYPASLQITLLRRQIDLLKLKSNNSFSIRQILLYYKNYNQMIRKMQQDNEFEQSILQLIKQHPMKQNIQ